jgi:arylsulfatase A-like enzyme
MGARRVRFAWAALGLGLAAGCQESAPVPATSLRLWCDVPARLEAAPVPEAAQPVFESHFERDLEGWRAIVNPGREAGGLVAERVADADRAALRLTGRHGGLALAIPVEPDTCYRFSGAARADGVVFDRQRFDGARFWLAEANAAAPFEEFRAREKELKTADWTSATAQGESGWKEIEHVFVTQPTTRFLHVVCSLATASNVSQGSVLFADLALERVAVERAWLDGVAREHAQRVGIEPDAAENPRRVSARLASESRPAFVLLPGERLRFSLPFLARDAHLRLGAGPFEPALAAARAARRRGADSPAAPGRLQVRAGSFMLAALDLELLALETWQELDCALPDGVRELELEFAPGSGVPLALGAPRIDAARAGEPRPNLLLISLDTVRADRLGVYGYAGNTTPNLDRLARGGVLCRDASAQGPYTLPTHASILTGQFPSVHGLVGNESRLSAARSTSLAEILARAGYRTRAFTSGGYVNPVFGLDQGFEAFSTTDPIREAGSHYFRRLAQEHGEDEAARRLEQEGYAAVERWLRARGAAPFFLFLHTYTVHDYDTPVRYLRCKELGCPHPKVELSTRTPEEAAAFTAEQRAHVQHLYDAALRYTDERLGALLELMETLNLRQNTWIVVTADHGEEFFEHGQLQHGRTLYQELLRIPLVFAGPGLAAREILRPCMQVDILPTVLARMGFAPPPSIQGVDVLAATWPERGVWSEVDNAQAHLYALRREDGQKSIHDPRERAVRYPREPWEHFDLGQDPAEAQALSRAGLESAREEVQRTRATLEALARALGAAGTGALDDEVRKDLEGLGYGGE